MFQAGRMKLMASRRSSTLLLLLPASPSTGSIMSGKKGGVRFVRSVQHDPMKPTGPTQFDNRFDNLDKAISKKNINHQDDPSSQDRGTSDVMSRSYGEGYATRSDEEGFGGTTTIYGGDDTTRSSDSFIHPAYDRTQGSEVKEKEKGRNSQD